MGFVGLSELERKAGVALPLLSGGLGRTGVCATGSPEREPDDGRVDGVKFDIEVMEALGERVGVERIPSPLGLDVDKLP